MEQEINKAVPDVSTSDAYRLLRYHIGWVDQEGAPVDTSATQGKALRPPSASLHATLWPTITLRPYPQQPL